jgi:hypothetical protein
VLRAFQFSVTEDLSVFSKNEAKDDYTCVIYLLSDIRLEGEGAPHPSTSLCQMSRDPWSDTHGRVPPPLWDGLYALSFWTVPAFPVLSPYWWPRSPVMAGKGKCAVFTPQPGRQRSLHLELNLPWVEFTLAWTESMLICEWTELTSPHQYQTFINFKLASANCWA